MRISIIPLVNLANPAHRKAIFELTPKLYELVAKYKGSITGEHNDGIIRTPYLNLMYRPEVLALLHRRSVSSTPKTFSTPAKSGRHDGRHRKVHGLAESLDAIRVSTGAGERIRLSRQQRERLRPLRRK